VKTMKKFLRDFRVQTIRKSSSKYDTMVSRFVEAVARK